MCIRDRSVSSTTCKTWPRQLTSCPSQTTAAVHSVWCAGTDLLGRPSPAWMVLFWFSSMLVCTNWKKKYTSDLPKNDLCSSMTKNDSVYLPPHATTSLKQPTTIQFSSVPTKHFPSHSSEEIPKASSKILTFQPGSRLQEVRLNFLSSYEIITLIQ